jgi:uncharacterized OsmC-like protein
MATSATPTGPSATPPGHGEAPSGSQGGKPSGSQGAASSGSGGGTRSGSQGEAPSGSQGAAPSGSQGEAPSGSRTSGAQGGTPSGRGDKPIIRRRAVSVRNSGGTKSVINTPEFGGFITDEPPSQGGTGAGPSPLQAVLGALCGCESVTFHRTASEMNFSYEGIDFDGEFTIDIRGRMGDRSVRPHFQRVRVHAMVQTGESADRLTEVASETERRCPVFNLLKDAGVRVAMVWEKADPGGSGIRASGNE